METIYNVNVGGKSEIELMIEYAASYYNTTKDNIKVELRQDIFIGDRGSMNPFGDELRYVKKIIFLESIDYIDMTFLLDSVKQFFIPPQNSVIPVIFYPEVFCTHAQGQGMATGVLVSIRFSKINP